MERLKQLVESILHLERTEDKVFAIKQQAINTMKETTHIMKQAGVLQNKVMKQTTTFYIAKAMGRL